MSEELTTAQVAERLDTPERTVRLWCKQGRFNGARAVETPRGSYWLVPEGDIKSFQKPLRGRTPAKVKTPADTTRKLNKAFRAATEEAETTNGKKKAPGKK